MLFMFVLVILKCIMFMFDVRCYIIYSSYTILFYLQFNLSSNPIFPPNLLFYSCSHPHSPLSYLLLLPYLPNLRFILYVSMVSYSYLYSQVLVYVSCWLMFGAGVYWFQIVFYCLEGMNVSGFRFERYSIRS